MQATFGEVLEKIEEFSFEEKETLIDILQNRLREYRRERLIKSINESRQEFERGELKSTSVEEIMSRILS